MAANKEIMAKIAEVERETPCAVFGTLAEHVNALEPDHAVLAVAVAEAVRQYAFQLRARAGLWEGSGAKGAKGAAEMLGVVAEHADALADGLTALSLAPPADAPARLPVEWCGNRDDHGPHDWQRNIGLGIVERQCSGRSPAPDPAGLNALINDTAALMNKAVTDMRGPSELADPLRANECCQDMIEPGEDPAPWCDGTQGVDHTGHTGSCKYRAHLRADHPRPIKTHAFEVAEGATGATCTAMVERDGGGDACGLPPQDPAHHHMQRIAAPLPPQGDPWLPSSEEVSAYLSGVTNDLPAAEPRGVTHQPAESVDALRAAVADPTPAEVVMAARVIGAILPTSQIPAATAPPLALAGSNPDAYDRTYVPTGGRALTFAELMAPVRPGTLPAHLSHSQINDAGDCGVKYRAQRVEGLPEVPQWANIGGTALHRAIEDVERTVVLLGDAGRFIPANNAEAFWSRFFLAVIDETAKTTGIPESRWRSSRRGQEGRTFWEVQGPQMLRRYLDNRPDEPTASFSIGPNSPSMEPAIEYAIIVSVPTPYGPLPFRAEIDRVTAVVDDGGLSFSIKDYKSSYERPSDPTQLGRYMWALRLAGVVPPGAHITGTYFDARRGEWTPPVDLAEAYPYEAFIYDVAAAHARKLSLTAGPTPARPSSYCGGCGVRYACPVMALRK